MAHAEEERKALGVRLAKARAAAGFSLETAASELTERGYPIGKAAIGAWETGRNLPDALWLKRLSKLYAASTDALVAAEDESWPFSKELRAKVAALDPLELHAMERAMWAKLDEDVPESVAESAKHRLRQRGAGVNTVTPGEKVTQRS